MLIWLVRTSLDNFWNSKFSSRYLIGYSTMLMSDMLTLTGFVPALINGKTVAPPNVTSLSCSRQKSTVDKLVEVRWKNGRRNRK